MLSRQIHHQPFVDYYDVFYFSNHKMKCRYTLFWLECLCQSRCTLLAYSLVCAMRTADHLPVQSPTLLLSGVGEVGDRLILNIYTVGHKKRARFIFSITLANIDGFS